MLESKVQRLHLRALQILHYKNIASFCGFKFKFNFKSLSLFIKNIYLSVCFLFIFMCMSGLGCAKMHHMYKCTTCMQYQRDQRRTSDPLELLQIGLCIVLRVLITKPRQQVLLPAELASQNSNHLAENEYSFVQMKKRKSLLWGSHWPGRRGKQE